MNVKKIAFVTALAFGSAAAFAQTTTPAATPTPGQHDHNINQRKVDQQDRVAQGVKSGQLTAVRPRGLSARRGA